MSKFRLGARARFWFGYWLPSCLVGGVARVWLRQPKAVEPQSILVLLPEHIGDIVFTGPLLRALRQRFPATRMIAVAPPTAGSLLEACPYLQEVIAWRPGLIAALRLGAQLRRLRCQWVIVPRADADQAWAPLVAVLTGAPRRLTLTDGASGWGRLKRLQSAPFFSEAIRPSAGVRHERLRRLVLAQHLGVAQADDHLESWTTAADVARADEFFSMLPSGGTRVAFGVGASMPPRRWPVERYAKVIDRLAERGPIVPVLIAPLAERPQVEAIRRAARTPVWFLTDATLQESAAVLRGCALFIGNDSGPAQLAAAAGIPVVMISVHPAGAPDDHPNSPEKCGPACAIARVVRPAAPAGAECAGGCVAAGAHCILGVAVEAVVVAAGAALAEDDGMRRENPAE